MQNPVARKGQRMARGSGQSYAVHRKPVLPAALVWLHSARPMRTLKAQTPLAGCGLLGATVYITIESALDFMS
jgi:hypothetical protein